MWQKMLCIVTLSWIALISGQIAPVYADENKTSQKYIKVDVKRKPSSKQWVQYDTRTVDMLAGFEPYQEKVKLDSYGGRDDRQANRGRPQSHGPCRPAGRRRPRKKGPREGAVLRPARACGPF